MNSTKSLGTIADNYAAQTKHVIHDKESGEKRLVSSFMEAKGGKWKSMLLRMDGEREDV